MVVTPAIAPSSEVFYPSSDGEPLAETSVHVDAIINIVVALRQYLANQPAIVLADQFLYYAQGFPKLRVAPDIMVIWNVPPGARDNYKVWEEGSIPTVIFEITSAGTRDQDLGQKKQLYEQIEVQEHWLFDPKGEWIPEQLRGYRLVDEQYEPITDRCSIPLNLQLRVSGTQLEFYSIPSDAKLLAPDELVTALQLETQARQEAETQLAQERRRAEQAEAELLALQEKLRSFESQ